MIKVAMLCHLENSKSELSILNNLNLSDLRIVDVSTFGWNEELMSHRADAVLLGRNTFRHILSEAIRMPIIENNYNLTKREKEIMTFAFSGQLIKEIADKLHISEKTVKSHLTNIYSKLGARTRTEALNKYYGLNIDH